jgi:hypothetical protein
MRMREEEFILCLCARMSFIRVAFCGPTLGGLTRASMGFGLWIFSTLGKWALGRSQCLGFENFVIGQFL